MKRRGNGKPLLGTPTGAGYSGASYGGADCNAATGLQPN
jgi:hypothetical protein